MSESRQLLVLLKAVEHLAELARLLAPFARSQGRVFGGRELVELAKDTAGTTYRYPNPEPAIVLAVFLGLLRRKGALLSLTEAGKDFCEKQGKDTTELHFETRIILLDILLGSSTFSQGALHVLSQFHAERGQLASVQANTVRIDRDQMVVLSAFQQLGLITYREGFFFLDERLENRLPPRLSERVKLTEEALLERLEAQRLRGKRAEELVVREERKRLQELGRTNLADLVTRVSDYDVLAGYDVESFERDGARRYIEVKSTIGTTIQFLWSRGERSKAAEERRKYWIYFVELSGDKEGEVLWITKIQDPIGEIRAKRLVEEPFSYNVTCKNRAAVHTLQIPAVRLSPEKPEAFRVVSSSLQIPVTQTHFQNSDSRQSPVI